jgi:hypothetical protein
MRGAASLRCALKSVRPHRSRSTMSGSRLLVVCGIAAAAVVSACALISDASSPTSEFGTYAEPPYRLVVSSDDTVDVYRMRAWPDHSGQEYILQLEYAAPFDVSDTATALAYGRRLWPIVTDVAEKHGLDTAVLTATNIRRWRNGRTWAYAIHHFGIVAVRDAMGAWRLESSGEPLEETIRENGGLRDSTGRRSIEHFTGPRVNRSGNGG